MGYEYFEDVGDESAGDEFVVLGEDVGYFVAVLLVAADEVGEGVVESPLEQEEQVLYLHLDHLLLDPAQLVQLLERLMVVVVRYLV